MRFSVRRTVRIGRKHSRSAQFLIAWDIVIFMLFVASLRIPLLFSLILGAGVAGVTQITIGVLE